MGMELDCPSICFQRSKALTGFFCIEGSSSLSVIAGVSTGSGFHWVHYCKHKWIWKCFSPSLVQMIYIMYNGQCKFLQSGQINRVCAFLVWCPSGSLPEEIWLRTQGQEAAAVTHNVATIQTMTQNCSVPNATASHCSHAAFKVHFSFEK